jgi:hypothetical protein
MVIMRYCGEQVSIKVLTFTPLLRLLLLILFCRLAATTFVRPHLLPEDDLHHLQL